mmetsp:Transcript_194/g.1380  ORF Transcript_194/g.1380 Transcript_194/m.1380 type:complete len:213 (-) Transcript_194:127-765(-)
MPAESEPTEEGGEDVLCSTWIVALLVLLQSFFPVSIVDLPFFGAGKHFVRVVDFRELLVGLFVPWILVGMVLQRQLSIRFLDLGVRGGLSQSQRAVVIRPARRIVFRPASPTASASIRARPKPRRRSLCSIDPSRPPFSSPRQAIQLLVARAGPALGPSFGSIPSRVASFHTVRGAIRTFRRLHARWFGSRTTTTPTRTRAATWTSCGCDAW